MLPFLATKSFSFMLRYFSTELFIQISAKFALLYLSPYKNGTNHRRIFFKKGFRSKNSALLHATVSDVQLRYTFRSNLER